MCAHVHTHAGIVQEWKEQNLATCNMVGPRGSYSKWNKSDRKTAYDFIHKWNLRKTNKRIKKTKQKLAQRYREQGDGCQRGGWSEMENKVKMGRGLGEKHGKSFHNWKSDSI